MINPARMNPAYASRTGTSGGRGRDVAAVTAPPMNGGLSRRPATIAADRGPPCPGKPILARPGRRPDRPNRHITLRPPEQGRPAQHHHPTGAPCSAPSPHRGALLSTSTPTGAPYGVGVPEQGAPDQAPATTGRPCSSKGPNRAPLLKPRARWVPGSAAGGAATARFPGAVLLRPGRCPQRPGVCPLLRVGPDPDDAGDR